jgi:predicted nucleic acid-binding protein
VKIYVREQDSDDLDRRLEGRRDVLVSDLTITELASSLGRRRREGTLPEEAAEGLYRAVWDDLRTGMFRPLELSPATFREAERLMLSGMHLRAGDGLHLAAAALAGAETMMTFDRRLAASARTLGLDVIP